MEHMVIEYMVLLQGREAK